MTEQPVALDLNAVERAAEALPVGPWNLHDVRTLLRESCTEEAQAAAVVLTHWRTLLALAREAAGLRAASARLAPYFAALLAMADPDGTRVSDDLAAANDVYLHASDVKALLAALAPTP